MLAHGGGSKEGDAKVGDPLVRFLEIGSAELSPTFFYNATDSDICRTIDSPRAPSPDAFECQPEGYIPTQSD